jgi:hypothetical protein
MIEQLRGRASPTRARLLLGFSQTCALNYRFAFTHAGTLRGVVGICGGLPGDWETGERYQTHRPPCCIWRARATNSTRRARRGFRRAPVKACPRCRIQEL